MAVLLARKRQVPSHLRGIGGTPQQVDLAGAIKVFLRLRPTQEHQARGDAAHPNGGGQRLCLQSHGTPNASLLTVYEK